jgi:hypothetical protein
MNGLERDFGGESEFGDDGIDLSSLTSAAGSAAGLGSNLASSASGLASSAVSTASGLASTASSAVGDVANMSPQDAMNAGLSVLATAGGVTGAAAGIASSLDSGDWSGAASQALQLAQAAANGSSDSAIKAGESLAIQGASAGAAIGTVVPIIGNVVGAVIGAIVGFCEGVLQTVAGNLVSGASDQSHQMASNLEKTYEGLRFDKPADRQSHVQYVATNPMGDTGYRYTPPTNAKLSNGWFDKGRNATGSRDWFWGYYLIPLYESLQGSGAGAHITMVGSTGISDFQNALNDFMTGRSSTSQYATIPLVDLAMWLAQQSDGVKLLKAMPPDLQAQVAPLMPLAIASALYLTFVPIIAAAGCYSPLALNAVRAALTKEATTAGSQVAQIVALSIPSDDLSMLLHAYSFLGHGSPLWYAVPGGPGDQSPQASGSIWSGYDKQNNAIVKGLVMAIAQCLASKASSGASAMSLLQNANTTLGTNEPRFGAQIAPADLSILFLKASLVSKNWKAKYTGDCLRGLSTAALDKKIGLTPKLGGVTPVVKPIVKPVTKPAATPKSNLTSHHWWIEAAVASLVGMAVYEIVHLRK